jgi:RimJ/RimL family protein N-acetyltransferase
VGAVRSGFEQVVGPLRLRRPTRSDIAAYTRLHTDARTYAHAPETMPDSIRCRIRLDDDLEHWDEHGFGYLAVEELGTGQVIGWGGVRSYPHHDALNLYYRLGFEVLGQGYGRIFARAVTISATEVLPDRPVRASIRRGNLPSTRTALAAGLVLIGPDDLVDTAGSDLYELPRVSPVGNTPTELPDFGDPTLPKPDLPHAWSCFGELRAPDGRLLGYGGWPENEVDVHDGAAPPLVVVDPQQAGHNFEALLEAGLRASRRAALSAARGSSHAQ